MPTGTTKPPDDGRTDFLWKVIGRYDTYIGSTNTKAAIIGTFTTFVFGAAVLKWNDIATLLAGHPKLTVFAITFVASAAVTSFFALWFTFSAITPFTDSPKTPGQYHSDIFFEHVAEHPDCGTYFTSVNGRDEASRVQDLCYQAHSLSKGLTSKMNDLKKAVRFLLASLVAIVGIFICLLLTTLP